jgi:coproporphyrinogen III oxidase
LAGLIAARFRTAKGHNWHSRPLRYVGAMLTLDEQQQSARDWFESLRDRICAEFEQIEREAGSEASFEFIPWERTDAEGGPGGGGVRGQMGGKVFEKVGVNVSTVGGRFSPEFAASIHGAEDDPRFFATGISLVAHMANPHVPAVHMNTRFLATTRRWFGGGADLNPAIPYSEDTEAFHARLRAACAAHDPTFYPRFSKWAEDYFFLPHRGVARGVGGVFYDHLECFEPGKGPTFAENFAFTRDVGEAFLDVFPKIVRARRETPYTDEDMSRLLEFRGRYVEFNLLYDRGTLFGLKTGGNIDAILMSLPPLAAWK